MSYNQEPNTRQFTGPPVSTTQNPAAPSLQSSPNRPPDHAPSPSLQLVPIPATNSLSNEFAATDTVLTEANPTPFSLQPPQQSTGTVASPSLHSQLRVQSPIALSQQLSLPTQGLPQSSSAVTHHSHRAHAVQTQHHSTGLHHHNQQSGQFQHQQQSLQPLQALHHSNTSPGQMQQLQYVSPQFQFNSSQTPTNHLHQQRPQQQMYLQSPTSNNNLTTPIGIGHNTMQMHQFQQQQQQQQHNFQQQQQQQQHNLQQQHQGRQQGQNIHSMRAFSSSSPQYAVQNQLAVYSPTQSTEMIHQPQNAFPIDPARSPSPHFHQQTQQLQQVHNSQFYSYNNTMHSPYNLQPMPQLSQQHYPHTHQAFPPSSNMTQAHLLQPGLISCKFLPADIKEEHFLDLFRGYGEILSYRLHYNVKTHSPQSSFAYGLICFSDPEAAIRAIAGTDRLNYQGRVLKVHFHDPSRQQAATAQIDPQESAKPNVYVANLPSSWTKHELLNHFTGGTYLGQDQIVMVRRRVLTAKVLFDVNGLSRHVGFVQFANVEDATDAIKANNGVPLAEGCEPCICRFARDDPKRAPSDMAGPMGNYSLSPTPSLSSGVSPTHIYTSLSPNPNGQISINGLNGLTGLNQFSSHTNVSPSHLYQYQHQPINQSHMQQAHIQQQILTLQQQQQQQQTLLGLASSSPISAHYQTYNPNHNNNNNSQHTLPSQPHLVYTNSVQSQQSPSPSALFPANSNMHNNNNNIVIQNNNNPNNNNNSGLPLSSTPGSGRDQVFTSLTNDIHNLSL